IERVVELGGNATHYGRALGTIANLTLIAFIISRWGRAVWARACRLSEANGVTPGREVWRVPFVAFASYLFVSTIAELLYYATSFTIIGPLFAVLFAGLAMRTIQLDARPGIVPALRRLGPCCGPS